MNIDGLAYRTIWIDSSDCLMVIDQRKLPHHFHSVALASLEEVCEAIRDMTVRGAGLIGATAGYGMWVAARAAAESQPALSPAMFMTAMEDAAAALLATRPTAGNLARAVRRQLAALSRRAGVLPEPTPADLAAAARQEAETIADEDAAFCRRIGEHGKELIRRMAANKAPGEPVRVLTHCNAGWLAFVDYGSALAPVYAAFAEGVPVHVWVSETRPRNQGAALTAWELAAHGVPHTLVADNACGHLMQHGLADLVLVGADRVTRRGDAANKIGTYLKALAARDNGVPFYVALPSSTFDPLLEDGVAEIPIEERNPEEVRHCSGQSQGGETLEVRVCPDRTPARNWAFDVTPARLITGLVCERGICPASEEGILQLFPEWRENAVRAGDESFGRKQDSGQEQASGQDEGVVKYAARHAFGPLPAREDLARLVSELDAARTFLHDQGLIGVNASGIGYGNISARLSSSPESVGDEFVISGSGTGAPRVLGVSGYSLVHACDAERNSVVSSGPARPSSEAMTHAAIYAADPRARFVVHIHHSRLFAALLREGWPHTPASAAYGTPEMAEAVAELLRTPAAEQGVFVTAGHADGLFAFGGRLEAAVNGLVRLLARCCGDGTPPVFALAPGRPSGGCAHSAPSGTDAGHAQGRA